LTHENVEKVSFLGLLTPNDPSYEIYRKQYKAAGAMISFKVKGGEKEAFRFLNSLKLIKLAVSLGSTESLAQHPASMTHAGVSQEVKAAMDISDNLVRISVGVENSDDIIWDVEQALSKVYEAVLAKA
jgi:methionine-gamma-lyase